MRALCIILFALMLVALAPIAARAQAFGPHVLYQVDPSVSPSVAQHVGELLATLGEVISADSPARQGDIAVAAAYVQGANGNPVLRLTYYDAVTAVSLSSDDLALRDGELKSNADRAIVEQAQSALAIVAPNTSAAPGPVQPSPARGVAPLAPDADAQAAAVDASLEATERPLAAMLGVGVGLGMYGSAMPLPVGSARVPVSTFPAFDIALDVDGIAQSGVTPGLHLLYVSSIGYTLSNTSPDGVVAGSAARTHQLRVDAAINVNFGHSRNDVSLPISVGYAWSNLRTDTELLYVYRHTLSGPHLALELRLPLAGGDVVLIFGPDVRFVLAVSDRIARAGLDTTGFVFGGEAELLVQISQRFALRAMFRESHAAVSSKRLSGSFTETQRFVTVGAAATY